jgi:hypothetical protein
MAKDNLTNKQKDYALFLPALSGFYATFIGKQRVNNDYVDPARLPDGIKDMEELNWLNPDKGLFPYKWSLYSAGHANLDLTIPDPGEDMVRDRDPSAIILGDSGGFQIAKGQWPGNWKDPDSAEVAAELVSATARGTEVRTIVDPVTKKSKTITVDLVKEHHKLLADAQKKRDGVLKWLDGVSNYGMVLDIPAWVANTPERDVCGVRTYDEAVAATQYNNEYFIKHRKGVNDGGTKFLNVMQGSNHAQANDWYGKMKKYCDPNQYPDKHFNGWAFGGQTKTDVHLMLKRLVEIRFDGLMQQGKQDWLHVLGTSKLEFALLLTDVQRAIRKHVNPDFTISFDCASPFLATANGQIYYQSRVGKNPNSVPTNLNLTTDLFDYNDEDLYSDHKAWSYRMIKSLDDKKYAIDHRSFRDAAMQDFPKRFPNFEDSPITELCEVNDICFYKDGVRKTDAEIAAEEGIAIDKVQFDFKKKEHYHVIPDLNKIDKIGRTSWDSFSYALQMGHNVYLHIFAVQEANRQYDAGSFPQMMEYQGSPKKDKFRDVVDAIFAAPTKDDALAIIDHYNLYWMEILGNHGYIGKKVMNATTHYENMKANGIIEEIDLSEGMAMDQAEDEARETVSKDFNPDL